MAGKDNLRVPTSEQAREYGRRGGIKSAEARAKRKTLKQELQYLLSQDMTIKTETKNNKEWITTALVHQAIKGNVKAYETIRDGLGENPIYGDINQTEVEKQIIQLPAKDIAKSFVDINRSIDEREYREYYLERW